MDITPLIPAESQVIDSYTTGAFRVSGILHQGSIAVGPRRVAQWPVRSVAEVDYRTLIDAAAVSDTPVEILLLGCGARMQMLHRSVRQELSQQGLSVEVMDTGAACRTYNVLLAEGRRVVAALIALEA